MIPTAKVAPLEGKKGLFSIANENSIAWPAPRRSEPSEPRRPASRTAPALDTSRVINCWQQYGLLDRFSVEEGACRLLVV